MVLRIQKPSSTSADQMQYNLTKYLSDKADIVFSTAKGRNPFKFFWDIIDREKMADRSNVKNRSFHLTINPDTNEPKSDKAYRELAGEIMEKLGYKDQPWMMYRHRDIDRIHYHIVSTRVKADGTLVPSHKEGSRLYKIGKELGKKYGYVIGIDNGQSIDYTIERFDEKKNKTAQMEAIVAKALSYQFRNLDEYYAILNSMGVAVKTSGIIKNNISRIRLQGLDRNYRPCTWPVTKLRNKELTDGPDGLITEAVRIAQENEKRQGRRTGKNTAFCESVVRSAISHSQRKSDPEESFLAYLNKTGIHPVIVRDQDTKDITDVILVDSRYKEVNRFTDLGICSLKTMNELFPNKGNKKKKAIVEAPSLRENNTGQTKDAAISQNI